MFGLLRVKTFLAERPTLTLPKLIIPLLNPGAVIRSGTATVGIGVGVEVAVAVMV